MESKFTDLLYRLNQHLAAAMHDLDAGQGADIHVVDYISGKRDAYAEISRATATFAAFMAADLHQFKTGQLLRYVCAKDDATIADGTVKIETLPAYVKSAIHDVIIRGRRVTTTPPPPGCFYRRIFILDPDNDYSTKNPPQYSINRQPDRGSPDEIIVKWFERS